jgi:hypothetical protein
MSSNHDIHLFRILHLILSSLEKYFCNDLQGHKWSDFPKSSWPYLLLHFSLLWLLSLDVLKNCKLY